MDVAVKQEAIVEALIVQIETLKREILLAKAERDRRLDTPRPMRREEIAAAWEKIKAGFATKIANALCDTEKFPALCERFGFTPREGIKLIHKFDGNTRRPFQVTGKENKDVDFIEAFEQEIGVKICG